MNKNEIFGNYSLDMIATNPDFKEDSVREVIILPILLQLGYDNHSIVRSKSLKHPFIKVGSKKRPVTLVPDYAMLVENNFAWVLDAKSPNQKIINSENVEQVYSYAMHPEIRSYYFALCNGLEFAVYRTSDTSKPVLYFQISEIEDFWINLKQLLGPDSFQIGKNFRYENTQIKPKSKEQFEFLNRPLLDEIIVQKQAAKRHFGCNAYFTRQTWNVVASYIKNYSRPGDLILDPFGGSGVTAIEALMNNRKAINIDLNPMAVFIVDSLVAPIKMSEFVRSFERVKNEFLLSQPTNDKEIKKILKRIPGPKPLPLPKGSDVATVTELFNEKQIAELSLLKHIINKERNVNIRKSLLLAFYNTISVCNLTFHETPKGGGNHFGYYYRYRLAPQPALKDTIKVFENKFKRVLSGKKEMEFFINENTIGNLTNFKGTATNLKDIPKESVDYIYTDPPYGKKIPYLDLSTMWNAWLDLEVSEQDFELEAIVGGEKQKNKEEYNSLIAQSIKEMYRVLKFDRWLSFVFAHKDPEFWHLIIDTAESCGFEYVAAIPQKNGQTSFKKRQNPFTVLSGQLIINFRKVRNPKAILKANLGFDIADVVMQTIEGIIAKNDGAKLEQINDELIIKGLELGFLDLLKKEYADLTPLLLDRFDFDESSEKFTLKKDSRFTSHIDVKLRIKYYLISFLRRMDRENKNPSFDEIIMAILPLLKNGITPEDQTILTVLEDIAIRVDNDSWKIKEINEQITM